MILFIPYYKLKNNFKKLGMQASCKYMIMFQENWIESIKNESKNEMLSCPIYSVELFKLNTL